MKTISEMVRAALRMLLDRRKAREVPPRLPRWDSGGARVDVADREALYDAMERRSSSSTPTAP